MTIDEQIAAAKADEDLAYTVFKASEKRMKLEVDPLCDHWIALREKWQRLEIKASILAEAKQADLIP